MVVLGGAAVSYERGTPVENGFIENLPGKGVAPHALLSTVGRKDPLTIFSRRIHKVPFPFSGHFRD